MSARAMRKLKGEDALLIGDQDNKDDEESESDDDEPPQSKSAFAFLPSDSSSDEEEESDEENDEDKDSEDGSDEDHDNATRNEEALDVPVLKIETDELTAGKTEEDLDAILDEFREQDEQRAEQGGPDGEEDQTGSDSEFSVILKGLDERELDVDWTMRNVLTAADEELPRPTANKRKNRIFLFGTPSQTDAARPIKPPNYMGGGIGMVSYSDDAPDGKSPPIPFIYASSTTPQQWYRFIHATDYLRDLEDYRYIQQTGDLNTLLFFVAHHPFVTDALLQVTNVLYQTNNSQNALAFLRRCLWIHENACLVRFHSLPIHLMDYELKENKIFFDALRKIIHVSSISGLWRTSLAVSRYVLALDPLRDPLCVLAVLDSYALCCHSFPVDQWIVELVQSDVVRIRYASSDEVFECELCGLPGWAYSYALALFRTSSDKEVANVALRSAIKAHPSVVGLLLQAIEVDTTGRSMRRDWISVLDKATDLNSRQRSFYLDGAGDAEDTSGVLQTLDNLINTFVGLGAKAYADDEVLQFLYDNMLIVVNSGGEKKDDFPPLQHAVLRYSQIMPGDWEARIQQLPEDANIVDPGLVAQALVIDTNRPRLLRRQQQAHGVDNRLLEQLMNAGGVGMPGPPEQPMFGGAPTGVIDPDLPMAEIFWRSFLPWNRVDGVQENRR